MQGTQFQIEIKIMALSPSPLEVHRCIKNELEVDEIPEEIREVNKEDIAFEMVKEWLEGMKDIGKLEIDEYEYEGGGKGILQKNPSRKEAEDEAELTELEEMMM